MGGPIGPDTPPLQDLVYNLELRHNARNAVARNTAHQLVTDRCRGRLYDAVHTAAHVTRQIAIDLYGGNQGNRSQEEEAKRVLVSAEEAWNAAIAEFHRAWTAEDTTRSYQGGPPSLSLNAPFYEQVLSPALAPVGWRRLDSWDSL